MSEIVIGEVDWNSADDSGSKGKTEFLRLEQGDNTVRILANPTQFFVNWITLPDGKSRKINSPIGSPELMRRLEDAGFKKQAHWFVKVLDRRDETFKVLEIGPQIFSGIKALFNNKKWGKVTAYDITIEKGPKDRQPLYRVTPDPKEPLDEKFKEAFIQFNDSLNLERLTQPSDPAEVLRLLGWSEGATESDTIEDSDQEDSFFNFKS